MASLCLVMENDPVPSRGACKQRDEMPAEEQGEALSRRGMCILPAAWGFCIPPRMLPNARWERTKTRAWNQASLGEAQAAHSVFFLATRASACSLQTVWHMPSPIPARRLAARIGRNRPPPSRQLPWEPSVAEGHLSLQSPALQLCRYFPFGPAEGHGLGWGCVIYGCWNESLHARREDPFSPPLDLMHFSYLVNLPMAV